MKRKAALHLVHHTQFVARVIAEQFTGRLLLQLDKNFSSKKNHHRKNSPRCQKSRRRQVYLMLSNAIVIRFCVSFRVRPSISSVSFSSSKFKFNAHSSLSGLFVLIGFSLRADGRRAIKLSAFGWTVIFDGDFFTESNGPDRFVRPPLTGVRRCESLSSSSSSVPVSHSLSTHSVWFFTSFKSSPALKWLGNIIQVCWAIIYSLHFTKHLFTLYIHRHTHNSPDINSGM